MALDHLKSYLQNDIHDVKAAITSTNNDIDSKVAAVSGTIDTLQDNVNEHVKTLHDDLSDNMDAVHHRVDNAITSACSEWHADINHSLLSTRSELASTIDSFGSQLQDTNQKLATMINTFDDKITTIETLSVSDSQVLHLLNGSNLDHIRNLTLSPAIDEVISQAIATIIAPISQELLTLKNLSTVISSSPKPKLGFAQIESKDFCVSKFMKELERIKLQGDNLKDLELF